MKQSIQAVSVWLGILVVGLLAASVGILLAGPSLRAALLGLGLFGLSGYWAVTRPFGMSPVPIVAVASIAYVSVQALGAMDPTRAVEPYLRAASIGALSIVLVSIIGDRLHRLLLSFKAGVDSRDRAIEELQLIDAVSGALTYAHGMRRIEDEIQRSQRYGKDFSLIALGLDEWGTLADTRTDEQIREIIIGMATAYRSAVRPPDQVIRAEGAEFFVLLPEIGMDDAALVATRLCGAASAVAPRTVRAGVAAFPISEVRTEALVREVRTALEFARTARVLVAGPDLLA